MSLRFGRSNVQTSSVKHIKLGVLNIRTSLLQMTIYSVGYLLDLESFPFKSIYNFHS